jgi:cell division protein FtsW
MLKGLLNKVYGDKMIWLIVILLSVFSALSVYSSTGTLAYKYQSGNTEYYLLKHMSLFLFGFLLMYLAHLANYRIYSRIAQLLLIVSIPLLLFTLFFGSDINEAKRWITLPVINLSFQTSDLAKLALIMYTARFLSKNQEVIKDFRSGYLPIILVITVVCMIIAPADLSSAAVLFATCLLLMFIGRVRTRYIFATIGAGIVGLSFIILLAYAFPDVGRFGTWKNRIESFMGADEVSYQVQQSKIAISEGKILGKGPGNSTQRNFLPHPYSDFIYSIILEEYGLAGGALILFLYLGFLYRVIIIVIKSPGTFGALLAAGLAFSLVIQALVNMAVAVNLMPVTGLTLPLISMGGTSLWFTSIAIGIILSVSRNIESDQKQSKGNMAEEGLNTALA